MKIGIYNDASRSGNTFDGSVRVAIVLADLLSRSHGATHEVELVHHDPNLTRERLAAFSGMALNGIRLRHVPDEESGSSRNPLRRYGQARDWHAGLSTPYDLFINIVHTMPPFCHARRGILIVLFPFFDPAAQWSQRPNLLAGDATQNQIKQPYLWAWQQRMNSYALKFSISRFVRDWTHLRWGVPSEVLYPPADTHFEVMPKDDLVMSVGRFALRGVLKRQFEMMQTWANLQREGTSSVPRGWKYLCTGSARGGSEEQVYVQNVRAIGEAYGGEVAPNMEWARLQELYGRAKIFWHAAGYGVDEMRYPQEVEHFGIVTVEAMAAGCVPVVFNKGGQPEIVLHGVSGFVWDTLDELKEYTSLLASNEILREQMSQAAREWAQQFSRESFEQRFLQLAQPLLD